MDSFQVQQTHRSTLPVFSRLRLQDEESSGYGTERFDSLDQVWQDNWNVILYCDFCSSTSLENSRYLLVDWRILDVPYTFAKLSWKPHEMGEK